MDIINLFWKENEMHWAIVAAVYIVVIFLAVFLLYLHGETKPQQGKLQNDLDMEAITDPAQRINSREWMQPIGIFLLFVVALWTISQYYLQIWSLVVLMGWGLKV
ncbi:MAG: hypothetical protein UW27_C0005G0042 [Parcubacteria group bacterium GW2011_GWA1_44_13]|uniref:Uncharacterized protein n=1 Tax=Candidatus Nomurabacteria bacterium GW2011_GWB1_44_12 TaxID=1618748 RepID=A0A837IHS0_9BACT|nr:MAG: hypothetical protein UW25_C0004G0052 [Candidatus Nomurabacteria bacterium GW2011_GWB1_44_12]KKT38099.1 MAG: hypothetical protein UW27_C0005G0042 [Parcubacteria group bacterium GW2011_GWA1_44_13]HBB43957.1 hypothetical protein [Candidatus Yonathbacteria bacterium]